MEPSTADFKIANQYLRTQQPHKAIVFYDYALQRTPDSSAVYENLGDALYHSEQYEKAEAAYQSAIALDEESAYAHAQLGQIYGLQQQHATAIAAYRQAIALDPTCIPFSYDLAQVLLAQEKPAEAGKVYKRLGAMLRQAGMLEDAIAAYQKALSLQPTSATLHQAAGECYHLQSNFSAAVHHYQQVAQYAKGPQHLWFYKNWGEAMLLSAPSTTTSAAVTSIERS